MSRLNVLVVGASIAGPATAYWLAKAGASVTVIERFPELRTGGQAIDVRTAGVSVMRKMPGMEAQVRAKTTEEEGVSFVREDGRPWGVLRATGNPDQQSLISEFEILRGDLSRILYDMTKDSENIRYVFGEQIVSIQHSEKEGGPVTVEFASGTSSQEYDLVVACDGATSRTRAIGLGCGVRDHIVSANCWAAYFSSKLDVLEGSKIGYGFSAPGGRFFGFTTDPLGFSRVNFGIVNPRDKPEALLPFRQALAQGDEAVKKYISQRFHDVGWKANLAIEEMMKSEDFYASEFVQVKVPSIYKGRFVMVGDAGYAGGPSGGGTSLALTGAYILAGELGKHAGDLAAGLQGYEEQMKPLIGDLQKIPPFVLTILGPQTAWGIWLRNHIFAFIAWTGLVGFFSKYLGAAFASSELFPIPEYHWVA